MLSGKPGPKTRCTSSAAPITSRASPSSRSPGSEGMASPRPALTRSCAAPAAPPPKTLAALGAPWRLGDRSRNRPLALNPIHRIECLDRQDALDLLGDHAEAALLAAVGLDRGEQGLGAELGPHDR